MSSKEQYSNLKALGALVRASLQSILKSPSAVVFGIAFPMVFILVFGFLGGGSKFSFSIAPVPGSDTNNNLYQALRYVDVLKWKEAKDTTELNSMLSDGDIMATIDIQKQPEGVKPEYKIVMQGASASANQLPQLQAIIKGVLQNTDPVIQERTEALADIEMNVLAIREFKTIDFILPGQLGFSLLAGSIFGTAFVFFNLRQTLVLKRFFATPVRKDVIVLSEGIARMTFQLVSAMIIITIGYLAFDYTLVHGLLTFIELLILSAIAILVFMGFGFIISGVAKSEATIPPLSNLITLPQFLLAGTFFPIDVFPKWLQPFCRILPLTYLNDAMRKVAFDGANLWDVKVDIIVLLAWGIPLYILAGRVFKWE